MNMVYFIVSGEATKLSMKKLKMKVESKFHCNSLKWHLILEVVWVSNREGNTSFSFEHGLFWYKGMYFQLNYCIVCKVLLKWSVTRSRLIPSQEGGGGRLASIQKISSHWLVSEAKIWCYYLKPFKSYGSWKVLFKHTVYILCVNVI